METADSDQFLFYCLDLINMFFNKLEYLAINRLIIRLMTDFNQNRFLSRMSVYWGCETDT